MPSRHNGRQPDDAGNLSYRIIYADPPWAYYGDPNKNQAAGKHYPCLPTEEICELPVAQIVDAPAALFLWATGPKMPDALQVMEAWGFHFRNFAFVWAKTRKDGGIIHGQGARATCVKQNAEYVLFGSTCRRGKPLKLLDESVGQIVTAPRGRHSEKPEQVAQRIEQLFGDVPRLEMFARRERAGWDVWGNEVDSASALSLILNDRHPNSRQPKSAGNSTGLTSLGPELLNSLLGSRDDAGILSSMDKNGGIGNVVAYRDRWRIDLGRAIERAVGARYIYGWGKSTSFASKDVADLILARINAEIGQGGRKPEDVVLDFLPAGKHTHVLARIEKWMEHLRELVESGDRSGNYTRDIERWVGEGGYFQWWKRHSLYAVDEATVEEFERWLAKQKIAKGRSEGKLLSGESRRNVMAAFHSFYVWARKRDNRVKRLRWFSWPQVDEPDVQVVTVEERDAVIAAIPEAKRGVFLAMRLGAPRPNMAVEILASDYDRKSRHLTLSRARKGRKADSPAGSTKNRTAWSIPVDPELAAWIEQWVSKEAFLQGRLLFENPDATNDRRAWTETRLRTNWAKACQSALGRHLPLYASMKHTFATNVIAGGGAESDLKDYLGHRDIRSTRRYVRAAKQRYGSIQSLGLIGPSSSGDAKSETGTDGDL